MTHPVVARLALLKRAVGTARRDVVRARRRRRLAERFSRADGLDWAALSDDRRREHQR